jgi:hypothetical protein
MDQGAIVTIATTLMSVLNIESVFNIPHPALRATFPLLGKVFF